MRIEFIGTGNAHGTPTPGCGCPICKEALINLERRRRAPCLAISTSDGSAYLVIDAGDPAINHWLERPQTAAVLLSHFHPGHIYGLLAYRRRNGRLPLFRPPDRKGLEALATSAEAFEITEPSPYKTMSAGPFNITPVLLNHDLITFGYCIEAENSRLAYLCDTCGLPPQTAMFLEEWKSDALIIDCNQDPKSPKPIHNTPAQAFKIHRHAGAYRSFLTHLSCRADAWFASKSKPLPRRVELAYDGMVIDLSQSANPKPNQAYV